MNPPNPSPVYKRGTRHESAKPAKNRKVGESSSKKSETPGELSKTSGKILTALKQDGNLTIPELSSLIGVTERSIERNIKKLQEQSRLARVGPAKGGHWEVR
jgi:predicted HTH transcriptional regulator